MPKRKRTKGESGSKRPEFRQVTVSGAADGPHKDHHWASNYVSTAKYNLLTYLPIALFEQYRRVANVYFTLMAALSVTEFSPLRPFTTFTPLVIVMGTAMVKEAYEDFKRHRADREENNRESLVWDGTKWEPKRWHEIEMGDLVKVQRDEAFPADLVLLDSSIDEGVCYIETVNLDGESNLKIKQAVEEARPLVREGKLSDFRGVIECELPNVSLYTFAGNILLNQLAANGRAPDPIPLEPSMVLLRGSSLRNTPWVIGTAVYTGHETKVYMNATRPPSKRSTIERQLDTCIYVMMSLLIVICVIGAIFFGIWTRDRMPDMWYLVPEDVDTVQFDPDKPAMVGFLGFLTSFILYGYLVPISLYVSVEIVKIIQSMWFIHFDKEMFDERTKQLCLARTSNLNEELGMIEIVLSDKTGTLTQNQMEFLKCSVAGESYGQGLTEVERAMMQHSYHPGEPRAQDNIPEDLGGLKEKGFNFWDTRILFGAWHKQPSADIIESFLRCLAVCHTVIPDRDPETGDVAYEAESPDEAALLVAAKNMGFRFTDRKQGKITVEETTPRGTESVVYEIVALLEFNSTRKRMSVIARREGDGRLLLFTKGADSVIYERLSSKVKQTVAAATREHLQEYGEAGLRTLCLAYAEIPQARFDKWWKTYMAARTSIVGREEKLMEAYDDIETDLVLLGCTAIEDKLQVGVPKTIETLLDGGIKVWVLTGDKLETAVNIGHACNLLRHDMTIVLVNPDTAEVAALEEDGKREEARALQRKTALKQLREAMDMMEGGTASREGGSKYGYNHALVITGAAIGYCMADEDARAMFWEVASSCSSVICCRVSPKQKAEVTALARLKGLRALGIGDGANDVGMIQEADIGVGISGLEGRQAVMSSDFAIGQFRFLETLLMVHGRWCYKRISRMVGYFFYKNLVFGLSVFYYNAFAFFSGQFTYDQFYIGLYNVIFTALPPVIVGVLDQDVDRKTCHHYPGLYRQGILNEWFGLPARGGWFFTGVLQSVLVFFGGLMGNYLAMSDSSGRPVEMWVNGVTIFTCVIITVHLQLAFVLDFWTWLHHFSIWGSIIVWFIFIIVYGAVPPEWMLDENVRYLFVDIVAKMPRFWLICLVVPVLAVLPDFLYRVLRRLVYPDDHHILQEHNLMKSRKSCLRGGWLAGAGLVRRLASADLKKQAEAIETAPVAQFADMSAGASPEKLGMPAVSDGAALPARISQAASAASGEGIVSAYGSVGEDGKDMRRRMMASKSGKGTPQRTTSRRTNAMRAAREFAGDLNTAGPFSAVRSSRRDMHNRAQSRVLADLNFMGGNLTTFDRFTAKFAAERAAGLQQQVKEKVHRRIKSDMPQASTDMLTADISDILSRERDVPPGRGRQRRGMKLGLAPVVSNAGNLVEDLSPTSPAGEGSPKRGFGGDSRKKQLAPLGEGVEDPSPGTPSAHAKLRRALSDGGEGAAVGQGLPSPHMATAKSSEAEGRFTGSEGEEEEAQANPKK
ncbi:unnamed protein product [Pedinophyceae sp. YPF-701]|nr:unnamed protein product [Pedinophyceae sp. YPF-701]